jgi:starvation-inducible outer membrane lipoprotein
MKKSIVLTALLTSVFLLAGCQSSSVKESTSEPTPTVEAKKEGDTTLTGKVVESGGKFVLQGQDGKQTEIDSYKVELGEFDGKQVTVTGQYSGETLFIANLQEE